MDNFLLTVGTFLTNDFLMTVYGISLLVMANIWMLVVMVIFLQLMFPGCLDSVLPKWLTEREPITPHIKKMITTDYYALMKKHQIKEDL